MTICSEASADLGNGKSIASNNSSKYTEKITNKSILWKEKSLTHDAIMLKTISYVRYSAMVFALFFLFAFMITLMLLTMQLESQILFE